MSEDDVILAGELALGVLEGDERAAAMRRVLAEPDFAALVARWRGHLATLHGEAAPVAAPAAIEQRVMAALAPRAADGSRWRALAVATSLIAASLAAVLVTRHPPPPVVMTPAPRGPVMVAALAPTAVAAPARKPVSALYDPAAAGVVLIGADGWPAGRSAELWVIAPGDSPRPLGLIGHGARVRVPVPRGLAAGATLAISIEPVGGSPTGAPTGPVVATGVLTTA